MIAVGLEAKTNNVVEKRNGYVDFFHIWPGYEKSTWKYSSCKGLLSTDFKYLKYELFLSANIFAFNLVVAKRYSSR